MKSFPMFIRTTGRRVVVAGGGEQAAQKTRLLLKTDGLIEVHASELDDELASLADEGKIKHVADRITETSFRGAAMAFIASGCPGLDASLHAIAKAADVSVNVVDQPDLCDLTTPSIVDRDPVVVAIGTEGTAPGHFPPTWVVSQHLPVGCALPLPRVSLVKTVVRFGLGHLMGHLGRRINEARNVKGRNCLKTRLAKVVRQDLTALVRSL